MNQPTFVNQLIAKNLRHQRHSSTVARQVSQKQVGNVQQTVTSENIGAKLSELDKKIEEAKKLNTVVQANVRQTNFTLADLNPLQQDKGGKAFEEDAVQEGAGFDFDKLIAEGADLDETLKLLRAHPDQLRLYMRKQAKEQSDHRQMLVERSFQKRVNMQKRYQQELGADYQPKQIVRDYQQFNRTIPDRQLDIMKHALKMQARIDGAKQARDFADQQRIERYEQKQLRPKNAAILPITFVAQRKQLMKVVFFSKVIAFLRDVSSSYHGINSSNIVITDAAIKIQKWWRRYAGYVRYQKQHESSRLVAQYARQTNIQYMRSILLKSLTNIRFLIETNYIQNTFLGAAVQFQKDTKALHLALCNNREKQQARMAIIISQMDLADGDVATDVFVDQQFQTYLDTVKQNKRAKKDQQKTRADFMHDVDVMTINDSKIQNNSEVWNYVMDIIYKKMQEELDQNQAQLMPIYMPRLDFCRAACRKIRELKMVIVEVEQEEGDDSKPQRIWEQAEPMQEWVNDQFIFELLFSQKEEEERQEALARAELEKTERLAAQPEASKK